MKYYLVLCAIFKNESHILEEWIQHYLIRGIEHIYLINDFSNDNYMEILNPYIENNKVTLFNNDKDENVFGKQVTAYNKFFLNLKKISEWLIIVDLDEFMYNPNDISIYNTVKKLDNHENKEVDQFKIWWENFGSNGYIEQPKSVVQSFTKRSPSWLLKEYQDKKKDFHSFKVIVRTKKIAKIGIHGCFYKKKNYDDYKDYMKWVDNNDLIINHYAIQSLEYFKNKKMRVGVGNKYVKNVTMNYFNERNDNKVLDNKLKIQSLNYLDELDDEVTLVITSCNRQQLLENTLDSFFNYNTYPIREVIIIEDSGKQDINNFCIKKYPEQKFILIYNKTNIGQIESIDIAYSHVKTKWLFHCEEDWIFFKKGFIEDSMNIIKMDDNKICNVWIRPINEYKGGKERIVNSNNNHCDYIKKNFKSWKNQLWSGFSLNPGLRKTKDALILSPYIKNVPVEKEINRVTEYTINIEYRNLGYIAAIPKDKSGYCKHGGQKEHVKKSWEK
tara:strand:+ start:108 stop:1607 length:1500 start_codon:yes stop_codon:yes gene_type:complete